MTLLLSGGGLIAGMSERVAAARLAKRARGARLTLMWASLLAVALILQSSGAAASTPITQSSSPRTTSCVGVRLTPADAPNIPSIVGSKPGGTGFCFAPGVYWMTRTITSLTNDRFIGTGTTRAGVVLTGSKLLTGWATGGGMYIHTGNVVSLRRGGLCYSGSACSYSDWLFRAGLPMRRTLAPCTSTNVRTGIFCVDYKAKKIFIHDNPGGVSMAYSYLQGAIAGGSGVIVRNLTIDKYANTVGDTATLRAGTGWLVDNIAMQYNHGCAIALVGSSGTVVQNSRFHDNGQLGYCGRTNGAIFRNNEVDHNNFLAINAPWGGGGGKFVHSNNVTVANNRVHDNRGNGIWFDLDSKGGVITGNTSTNNSGIYGAGNGITYEVSCYATILGNTSSGNGMAGIQLRASHHSTVGAIGQGNTVANNHIAGIRIIVDRSGKQWNCGSIQGSYNRFAYNNVTMPSGTSINGVQNFKGYVARYNVFTANDYHMPSLGCSARRWRWWSGTQLLSVHYAGSGATWPGTFKQDPGPAGSCQVP
jgi:hypothetical protein